MFQKRAIFINTASQVIVRFATLAFTLISVKLLTNYLGLEGTGKYNTITTFLNFIIVIFDLGLFSVTVREIAKNPDNEKKILSNVMTIRIISALVATLLAIGIVFLTNYDQNIKIGVLVAAGFVFFNLVGSIYDMVLQYRLKMQYSALSEFFSKIIAILALLLIIFFKGNFFWICSTILLSGISIFAFKRFFSQKFIKFSPEYDKKLSGWILNTAWPLGIVFIISNLFFKIDTIMLFIIKGAAAVGIYSVAYKVLEVTIFVGGYFAAALKPSLAQKINNNKTELSSIINKSIIVMLILSFPIALISILFSKDIIIFLSNNDFVSGAKALMIVSVALPLMYLDMLIVEIMIAKDNRKLLVGLSLFALLSNFFLNLYFIPRYSYNGAAFVTLVSEALLFFAGVYFTRSIVNYKIQLNQLLKLIGSFSLTTLFSFLLLSFDLFFIIKIALIVAFYIGSLYLFSIAKQTTLKELLKNE